MKQIPGGITAPAGFSAASCAAGIKYKDRDDMAMIVSGTPCTAAGVFTRNVVKAAPVRYDMARIADGHPVRAVVVNAGIANACTGTEGEEACRQTADEAADALALSTGEVLVASTGVIGMQLPMERLCAGIRTMSCALSDTREAGARAAKAIMTTDTHPKEAAVSFEACGVTCTIGAMAKGSGMIHPDMGTMLCFVTTDTAISAKMLQQALSEVTVDTFNMISVDGDTSTNDTTVVLANGMAHNPMIDAEGDDYRAFRDALFQVCREIAMMLAGDGEGATALFEVTVKGADTKAHARTLARSVIASSLTKAAINGHDANWGRILCALGYAGVDFVPEQVTLTIESAHGSILIYADGCATDYSEEEAAKILSADRVCAVVDMHAGTEEATAWGCDLSIDYVKINADYRS